MEEMDKLILELKRKIALTGLSTDIDVATRKAYQDVVYMILKYKANNGKSFW